MLTGTRNHSRRPPPQAIAFMAIGVFAMLTCALPPTSWAGQKLQTGIFLVATDRMQGTNFQETVILLTHHSKGGTTGLTINRPTEIPLNQAFPRIQQLNQIDDPLYLGGPVSANTIFVLINTTEPRRGMYLVLDNVYLATAKYAFSHPWESNSRTFAGYAGWAPGQLQHEILQGSWLVVKTDPDIVFEKDTSTLWRRLKNRWSGNWI